MTEKELTTGETSGITGIPIKTIQHYIKSYPEGFSETARQPNRGRRYSLRDIKTLLIIRNMRSHREPPDKIREAITGEQTESIADVAEAITIASAAVRAFDEAGNYAEEARRELYYVKAMLNGVVQKNRELTEAVISLEQDVKSLKNNYGLKHPEKSQPRQKSFVDKLLGD